MGLNYVPYERTYRGLPVVGGDFVVSTDDQRQDPGHQRRADPPGQAPLGQGHRGPKAAARATSARQLRHATLGKTRLVVLQQKSSRLAWETWVTGRKHGEPSRLTVYVDARTGRVLTTKEHVLEGTGNGDWTAPVTIPTTRLRARRSR